MTLPSLSTLLFSLVPSFLLIHNHFCLNCLEKLPNFSFSFDYRNVSDITSFQNNFSYPFIQMCQLILRNYTISSYIGVGATKLCAEIQGYNQHLSKSCCFFNMENKYQSIKVSSDKLFTYQCQETTKNAIAITFSQTYTHTYTHPRMQKRNISFFKLSL